VQSAGFSRWRRVAETPVNVVYEARPQLSGLAARDAATAGASRPCLRLPAQPTAEARPEAARRACRAAGQRARAGTSTLRVRVAISAVSSLNAVIVPEPGGSHRTGCYPAGSRPPGGCLPVTQSPEDDERESGEIGAEIELLAAERLIFFSDAVVAIAITLLSFGLTLPRGATDRQVLDSMYHARDDYLAFLISFAVIGNYWRSHRQLFRNVARLNGRVATLNMIWLLMIVITPFATRVISGDGGFGVRFTFYAVIQVVTVLCFLLMTHELRRNQLLRAEAPEPDSDDARLLAVAAMFLISIPVAFVTQWAFACWVAIPLVVRVVRKLRDRQWHHHDAA
jgi:uncharacterized membrane protein